MGSTGRKGREKEGKGRAREGERRNEEREGKGAEAGGCIQILTGVTVKNASVCRTYLYVSEASTLLLIGLHAEYSAFCSAF